MFLSPGEGMGSFMVFKVTTRVSTVCLACVCDILRGEYVLFFRGLSISCYFILLLSNN